MRHFWPLPKATQRKLICHDNCLRTNHRVFTCNRTRYVTLAMFLQIWRSFILVPYCSDWQTLAKIFDSRSTTGLEVWCEEFTNYLWSLWDCCSHHLEPNICHIFFLSSSTEQNDWIIGNPCNRTEEQPAMFQSGWTSYSEEHVTNMLMNQRQLRQL